MPDILTAKELDWAVISLGLFVVRWRMCADIRYIQQRSMGLSQYAVFRDDSRPRRLNDVQHSGGKPTIRLSLSKL